MDSVQCFTYYEERSYVYQERKEEKVRREMGYEIHRELRSLNQLNRLSEVIEARLSTLLDESSDTAISTSLKSPRYNGLKATGDKIGCFGLETGRNSPNRAEEAPEWMIVGVGSDVRV
jgi:hypothetical protein